jgi:transcriptional regulator with XRE-family HTH domain
MQTDYGFAIAQARAHAALTLSALARGIGVSIPYLHEVEKGKCRPLRRELGDVAAGILGIDPLRLETLAAGVRGTIDLHGLGPKEIAKVVRIVAKMRAPKENKS